MSEVSTERQAPYDGWKQTETLTLLRQLLEVAQQVRPSVAARAGLSINELVAVEHLFTEPLGTGEVGRRLSVTSAATSQIVDRLEQRGHVRREPHPTDRRRTLVQLTDSGRTEAIELLMPMFRALAATDADLDEDERAVIERYLRRAIGALRTVV
ncbi:MarR family transcriptional regulator [Nocardioides sp. zg-536]|uniref:MarR family transcriptional regulator n=1 Tax=Nocardioides faecalis TaxID=2803858 RepID=A0A939BRM6_9ACTN|nr:MarR family transcriptional regulator [Nocardioides faecalis]MBM9458784.1 MarR family transcriptional regulator [Nocardioides faecalis]QVI60202.1 MarR family transcriptional regulator [Nocardioides faecalis]